MDALKKRFPQVLVSFEKNSQRLRKIYQEDLAIKKIQKQAQY
jgi:hypothetical protein